MLASRLTLVDEKFNVVVKKSEKHDAALLLVMPSVAVLKKRSGSARSGKTARPGCVA